MQSTFHRPSDVSNGPQDNVTILSANGGGELNTKMVVSATFNLGGNSTDNSGNYDSMVDKVV